MARVFGVILDHLNTNTDQFYIMTSNNVADLPPELTRSGRLDTKWFFDFPRLEDRKEIFRIHFGKADQVLDDSLLDFAASKSKHFTGAEIENAVNNIVKNAFFRMINDKGDGTINEEDIINGINKVNTVYDTNTAEIKALQNYVSRNKIPSTVESDANSCLTTSNKKTETKESPYSFMDDAIVGK